MFSCRQSWIMLAAAFLVATCLGCGPGETPNGPDQPNDQSGTNPAEQGSSTDNPPTENNLSTEAPPAKMPEVFLTEEQRRSCVVLDGDIMPEAELPDLDGNLQPLAQLRGEKLTVVCLWKSGKTYPGELKAIEILGDLQDLADAYSDKGVRVVAINERDPPEVVRKLVAEAKAMFHLLDPDGAFFDRIATEKLPRVYLLDSEGKILWFDLEYSLTTLRILKKGIQVALGEI